MTALSEGDIVVRVLLNVLDPSAEQRQACTKKWSIGYRPRRASAGSRTARRPVNVVIVRRISVSAISVSWSDACLGKSTEQIWSRGFADGAAVCALTGRCIDRGDPVFRPHAGDARVPASRALTILAATVGQHPDPLLADT
ncbi:DUF3331 domain-containing protein [Burkholderia catarinensis]|uniref:DUF3331 domain-containing protein n=1 Tax=Burkholderia catarinensis TaxID=1108140 RepID=UPI0009234824|nr:DUF3331 domain-containing protein [Burkholderia catarinensis]KAG8152526.1 hypothetical protein BFF94_016530 [Burkholderia catarinensis]